MKAKLLLMLFLVSMGSGVFASMRPKKMPHAHCKVNNRSAMTRVPFEPSIKAEDINDCLYLTFQFSLNDVDIIVLDKNGNEVVNELQTIIYEGRTIAISIADAYPYFIEIITPTIEIQGEITLEEQVVK